MTWLYHDLQRILIQRLYDVAKTEYHYPLTSLDVNYFLRTNKVILTSELAKTQALFDDALHEFMKGMTANETTESPSNGPLWKL